MISKQPVSGSLVQAIFAVGVLAKLKSQKPLTTEHIVLKKTVCFCERIFGPERDYECGCGKYKGTKYKGIICDRCGVKVMPLACSKKDAWGISIWLHPVVHIWFFKALPSRLGTLLGMKTSDLEKIIYFQDYVVLDPAMLIPKERQSTSEVITEDEYREITTKGGYGDHSAQSWALMQYRELIEALDRSHEVTCTANS